MCGRTCCNHNKDIYIKASCQYNSASSQYETPEWKNLNNAGLSYIPSINCTPQSVTPVLVSGQHFTKQAESLINMVPMLWGIIPPWHTGDYRSHGLSTNNCRIESMTTSKLYSPSLEHGKRCVVLCEGFYEWQTTKKTDKKQPYYIYATQKPDVQIESVATWENGVFSSEAGWQGPSLLYLAGIFNKWQHQDGDSIYSYSILTMETNSHFSWLHHRMPAVLCNDGEVKDWLNYSQVSTSRALTLLKPVTSLQWHPVGFGVGNSRNKSADCNVRIDLKKTVESKSSKMMMAWLNRSAPVSVKREGETKTEDEHVSKKQKPNWEETVAQLGGFSSKTAPLKNSVHYYIFNLFFYFIIII